MIVLGSDHGGFRLKEEVKKHLDERGTPYVDVGCYDENSVDYPQIAKAACDKVVNGECELALLFCGTGVGISMAANKIKGIRAALCADCYSARMAKEHNNANVIAFGGRTIGVEHAWEMVRAYMGAEHLGGIHAKRVAQIDAL